MINMKIQDILKGYDIMIDCVPLSITEPGYAYLNACDTGIWVITCLLYTSDAADEL